MLSGEQMFQVEGYWGEGMVLDAAGAAVVLRVCIATA
mgnify:CR=1 FL=1